MRQDNTTVTHFENDLFKGKQGERIFKEEFLDFLGINYIDVTGCQQFQVVDTDFLAKIGKYEVKLNYQDKKEIIIEDYTDYRPHLNSIRKGWFYKSTADILVFISGRTKAMILVPFTKQFKDHYESIKTNHNLIQNKVSIHNGRQWQSAYRRIPLDNMKGYFAYYKRVVDGPKVEVIQKEIPFNQ